MRTTPEKLQERIARLERELDKARIDLVEALTTPPPRDPQEHNRRFRLRNREMFEAYKRGGTTFSAIAREYGLTPTRVRGIILKLAREEAREPNGAKALLAVLSRGQE